MALQVPAPGTNRSLLAAANAVAATWMVNEKNESKSIRTEEVKEVAVRTVVLAVGVDRFRRD
jgi:hypothetical protein